MQTMKQKKAITGDRPTGPLHLGHFVGSLQNRLHLEDSHDLTVLVADTQALTDHLFDKGLMRKNIAAVMKDYLAVGLDPDKTTFVLQSALPDLGMASVLLSPFVTTSEMSRNPTVRQEVRDKNFEHVPLGFFAYPLFQAADIILLGSGKVPVGDDQSPMIEITNKVVSRLNERAGRDLFDPCEAVYSGTPRLVGIDGQGKMSKSRGTAIALSASREDIQKSVMMMYTDPGHLKKSDPGKVEGNVVFAYLDAFAKDLDLVSDFKAHYRRGGLGDVDLKKELIKILCDTLDPIRARHAEISDEQALDVLRQGTLLGQKTAQNELEKIKDVLGILCLN